MKILLVLLGLFCLSECIRIEQCAPTSTRITDIFIGGCDNPDGSPMAARCIVKASSTYQVQIKVNPASALTGIRAEVSLRVRFIGNLGVVKVINNICNESIQCPTVANEPQWFNTTYTTASRMVNLRNVEVSIRIYSDQSGNRPEACSLFYVDVRRY